MGLSDRQEQELELSWAIALFTLQPDPSAFRVYISLFSSPSNWKPYKQTTLVFHPAPSDSYNLNTPRQTNSHHR